MRAPPPVLGVAVLSLLALVTLGGCDDEDREADRPRSSATEAPPVERARCPSGLAACRSASGAVLYVERVDPDGDGDAHFVLASDDDITSRGISVVDVRRDLRPNPLPGPGDRLSAAGPVHRGSYGQSQIEAVVVHATYTPRG